MTPIGLELQRWLPGVFAYFKATATRRGTAGDFFGVAAPAAVHHNHAAMSGTKRKTVYRGRVVDVSHESVTLPNGSDLELEIVEHPGGAAAVALDERGRVCLVHQYRHLAGGFIWELPAGRIDDGEAPIACVQRELEEEAGVAAKLWMSMGAMLSSPGVFDEVIHLWLATQLVEAQAATHHDEVLEVHWVDLDEALDWAAQGRIRDGKTIAGLLRATRFRSVIE